MTRKTVLITQSNYIPWKGYFDAIALADEVILLDGVQYTRRDWRNRNRIKTAQGPRWLTIPVQSKGRFQQSISETVTSGTAWAEKHWKTLLHHYRNAPYFASYRDLFENAYGALLTPWLSEVNQHFLTVICRCLDIATPIRPSSDFEMATGKTERIVDLCQKVGATRYLTGPRGLEYLNLELFGEAAVEVAVMDYSGYPEYPQFHPPFLHAVTVLDLLFQTGPNAAQYMKQGAAPRAPRPVKLHGAQ